MGFFGDPEQPFQSPGIFGALGGHRMKIEIFRSVDFRRVINKNLVFLGVTDATKAFELIIRVNIFGSYLGEGL